MFRTFLQITSISLTLEAAFFLAKGALGLSAETIAELSATKLGYNSGVIKSLASQCADTKIGVILLLAAFVLQLWNALLPFRWVDLEAHKGATIYALVFAVVIGFGAYFLSHELASNTENRVKQILDR